MMSSTTYKLISFSVPNIATALIAIQPPFSPTEWHNAPGLWEEDMYGSHAICTTGSKHFAFMKYGTCEIIGSSIRGNILNNELPWVLHTYLVEKLRLLLLLLACMLICQSFEFAINTKFTIADFLMVEVLRHRLYQPGAAEQAVL